MLFQSGNIARRLFYLLGRRGASFNVNGCRPAANRYLVHVNAVDRPCSCRLLSSARVSGLKSVKAKKGVTIY